MTGRGISVRCLMSAFLVILGVRASFAGVPAFIENCMANVGDVARLSQSLTASGMVEIDPKAAPLFLSGVPSPDVERVWALKSQHGDAFTGYIAGDAGLSPDPKKGDDVRVQVCWHVSRPGESPAAALRELKRLYPPLNGKVWLAPFVSPGMDEHWLSHVGNRDVIVGLDSAGPIDTETGTAKLYVMTMRPVR